MTQRPRHNGIALGAAVAVLALAVGLALLWPRRGRRHGRGDGAGAAERRRDHDRRPDRRVDAGDAEDAAAARRQGDHLREQLRQQPALLPLARDLPHRPVRPQHTACSATARRTAASRRFDDSETLPVWLQRAGYYDRAHRQVPERLRRSRARPTSRRAGASGTARSTPRTYRMYGYTLNENGTPVTYGDYDDPGSGAYQTDVYADKAADFIARRAPGARRRSSSVPRSPRTPRSSTPGATTIRRRRASRTPAGAPPRGAFADREPDRTRRRSTRPTSPTSRRPSAPCPPLSSGGDRARPGTATARGSTSLLAVDDMVREIVDALRGTGELDRTLIVFTSDNGFLLGEHRIPTASSTPTRSRSGCRCSSAGPGFPAGEVTRAARRQRRPRADDRRLRARSRAIPSTGGRCCRLSTSPTRERAGDRDRELVSDQRALLRPERPRYRGFAPTASPTFATRTASRSSTTSQRDPSSSRAATRAPPT